MGRGGLVCETAWTSAGRLEAASLSCHSQMLAVLFCLFVFETMSFTGLEFARQVGLGSADPGLPPCAGIRSHVIWGLGSCPYVYKANTSSAELSPQPTWGTLEPALCLG